MKKIPYILYGFVMLLVCIYSYALVDPNITFMQNRAWEVFREAAVYVGYYRRDISWICYVLLVLALFGFHAWFLKKHKAVNVWAIAGTVAGILVVSYPFLSHDLFNYMFDARIFTFYGKNPYLFKALDFPGDQWTRFMHWTHRTYPYGPVFLLLSFIPSALGAGKFTATFLLFKGMFVSAYLVSVALLLRMDKKRALLFATHPLVIMEGLVSAHNDLIVVALAVAGCFFLLKKGKRLPARFLFLLSGGVKYTSFAFLTLISPNGKQGAGRSAADIILSRWNYIVLAVQFIVLGYLSYRMGIQPWYFLTLFAFIPGFARLTGYLNIFFFGLMMSYYPYIRLGGWDTAAKVDMRHVISLAFLAVNAIYLLFLTLAKRTKSSR